MATPTDPTYIIVGKIGATHGVHGWLKIQSYTEFNASILQYQPWYLSRDGATWELVQIEQGRMMGDMPYAKFPEINNPEEARLLTGRLIAVKRSQLPELAKDEYLWSDLIGLTVIDQHGHTLGTVTYLMETGSNDVLVVKGEKEHAIPYLSQVILRIDLDKKEIHVDWELI